MEELDRKNIIQHETKVENEASSNFTTTSTMKNMFPHGVEQEMESFNWKVSRLVKFNRGIDRPKSYNPWMDRAENDAEFRRKLAENDLHKESFVKEVEPQVWPDLVIKPREKIEYRTYRTKTTWWRRLLNLLLINKYE